MSEVSKAHLFSSQQEDERVILLLRAHFVTNFPWILLSLIFVVFPILLQALGVFDYLQTEFAVSASSVNNLLVLWYLFIFAYAFQNFLLWYFNIYILTNERIVDMDFYQLLYRKVSTADLRQIEDITVTMGGVAQSIFNYGTINIQTAAEVGEFEFARVPNPTNVQKAVEEAVEAARRGR